MKTNISGFPEYLPSEQLAFNTIIHTITGIYQNYGYVPLETAAVERIDTLTSKGIDSKEVYALRRLNAQGDDGDKDIALRFDLTVPMARYVAQNFGDLSFPFRRYQCQPVWRGERAQKGRYRQFHQFDLDVIGDGTLPIVADAEVIAAAHDALVAVLPEGTPFTMRVNNRKLLTGLVQGAGYTADEQVYAAIKVIDDLEKIRDEDARERLAAINPSANVQKLIDQTRTANLNELTGLTDLAQQGLSELKEVLSTLDGLTGGTSNIVADLSIARGLDYYTGTVVETKLHTAPELGSVCSGGRYDNLAASLSERNLPGVGLSIGISRLAAWLMDQPPYNSMPATPASIIVIGAAAPALCQQIRKAGLACELGLGEKSAGQHFMAADKRGIKYGIVAETPEKATIRTFSTRQQAEVEAAGVVPYLQTLLDK
ncbi:MAG: histidine--tRNA ligase [Blastochloris viridis]|uniref:Histidine--tRNA ligase n=1 Tax=Blastochloris viridis TaxID=1079 RepID=A0A6N4R2B7_BLAVI|nr:MAG: histidine--tRNA ligase [Blastochloris viridis]